MGDLTPGQSSLPVRIEGANTSGTPTGYVASDANGNILAKDYADGTPGSAAPSVALQVGGSDGTNLRVNKVDANGSQYGVLTGPGGGAQSLAATANAFNQLRVSTDPTDLIHDKFNSTTTIDTTYRWNTPSTSGTGAAVAENYGLIFTPASTSGGYAVLTSQSSFGQEANTFLNTAFEVYLETSIATGYERFWGLATAPASPTTSAPLTDAVGFEINSSGILNAVIYQGGTLIFSTPITAPTDGLLHRYSINWRTDRVVFYLDSSDAYSALALRLTPNSTFLPVRMQFLTGPTTSGTPTFKFRQAAVSDQGRNNTALSDGTYGFIKGVIKYGAVAATTTDNALVVSLSPNSPVPAGTNSIGTVKAEVQDGSGNNINSYNSQLETADIVDTSLTSGSLSVGTSAVAARVSSTNLTNRKVLILCPTNGIVYIGATSSVTTSTGIPIFPNNIVAFSYGSAITPYLIAAATTTVIVTEGA